MQDLGFRVQGFGFSVFCMKVWGLELGVWETEMRTRDDGTTRWIKVWGSALRHSVFKLFIAFGVTWNRR